MKKCLLTVLAALATSTILAQVPTGPNRPSGVPEGYVITPFGYFHPSCVHTLAEGKPNAGRTPCAHPAFHPDGTPKVEGEKPSPATLPTINGWVESTNITAPTGKSFSAVYVTNVVPPTPANFEGQTLFFFPGLEDVNNTESILQPVLIYNVGGWSISNYNCCLSGVTNSTPIHTAPGDTIVSSITENCKPGTLTCATWDVVSLDLKTHKSTRLLKTPSDGQIFNWAFGAVLEPYNVNNCNDYPSKPETYAVLVFDEQFRPVVPKWNVSVDTTDSPQCGYGINAKPFQSTLQYNSTIVANPATLSVTPSSGTVALGAYTPFTISVGNLSPGQTATVTFGALPIGITEGYESIPVGVTTDTSSGFTVNQNSAVEFELASQPSGSPTVVQFPITLTVTGQPAITEYYTLTVE